MRSSTAALFYLGSHNEVDQISPILYKLGKRNNICVDIILEPGVNINDYRIQAVSQHKNVTILDQKSNHSDEIIEIIKNIGRKIPTSVPKHIYKQYIQSTDLLTIPEEFSNNEYDVIAFDWSHASRNAHFSDRDDLTTIVLPHGDSPFVNKLGIQNIFNDFVNDETNFINHSESITYSSYEEYLKYDYIAFPNELTASRMPKNTPKEQIKIFGSPRYNNEWLNILSKIRPTDSISGNSDINAVFFLRGEEYFIHNNEVLNTLNLINQFENINMIVKEHPRAQLLNVGAVDQMKNIRIITDEVSSASLIEWGDIFLSLGTTISFEPIMRNKPVLAIEYAHANHTVVSNYFSGTDIRCKDDLYHILHNFLMNGTNNFYEEHTHQQFIDEMISPTETPVLNSWATFIESQCN